MRKLTLILAVICSLSLWADGKNGIVYVKQGGNGDGSSWENAMGEIQAAIEEAKREAGNKKDVWVATGEYQIWTAITLGDTVSVYGSFKGNETAVNEREKVIDGNVWDFQNPTTLKGENVRIMQATGHFFTETIIDGFIFTEGNGEDATVLSNGGGGAAIARDNIIYQNCIFRNNSSTKGGGGAILMTGGTIRHCLVEENHHSIGSNGGGGIFSNPASGYNSYIEDCIIKGNTSTIRGAGIGVQGAGMTYINNVKVYDNIAADGETLKAGAAIYSNSASNTTTNCLIYNNEGASAIYYNGGYLYNNTIVKNVGGLYLAGNKIEVINNIVWACTTDNTGATATSITGSANGNATVMNNITYNPVPTDKTWVLSDNEGENTNLRFASNISNDEVEEPDPETVGSGPRFIYVSNFIGKSTNEEEKNELDYVDWGLNTNSPCINVGKKMPLVKFDYWGTLRPQCWPQTDSLYDVGAYELPYYIVVAGESENSNGEIVSKMGVLLEENHIEGYAKGSAIELYFFPKDNYEIGRAYYVTSTDGGITFTGEEVDFTDDIDEDGLWRSGVGANFKVFVVWNSTSSLSDLSGNNILVLSQQDGIEIMGVEIGEKISIYNTNGSLIYNSEVTQNKTSIPLSKGIYIVRISEGVKKVVVR